MTDLPKWMYPTDTPRFGAGLTLDVVERSHSSGDTDDDDRRVLEGERVDRERFAVLRQRRRACSSAGGSTDQLPVVCAIAGGRWSARGALAAGGPRLAASHSRTRVLPAPANGQLLERGPFRQPSSVSASGSIVRARSQADCDLSLIHISEPTRQ